MCLLVFAINAHPGYPLVVAANRDEFYERPTAAARFWDEAPHILAGRDLERGGTWLGITRDGRWAALTSYREPGAEPVSTSRGHLVSDFLASRLDPQSYARQSLEKGAQYAGFNLLAGDADQVVHCSNRSEEITTITEGVHGLSNHLLDTPWPKLTLTRDRFARALEGPAPVDTDALFRILGNREMPDDQEMPDTGVGIKTERLLAPAFISSATYGTRSSTVLTIDGEGETNLIERTFVPAESGQYDPGQFREATHRFRIENPCSGKG